MEVDVSEEAFSLKPLDMFCHLYVLTLAVISFFNGISKYVVSCFFIGISFPSFQ